MTASWPSIEDVLDIAKPFVKAREGYSDTPYKDQRGVPTIGYGTCFYPDGRAVLMSDKPIDTSFAEVCLTAAMTRVWDVIRVAVLKVPTAHQAAAFLSLTYNIGAQDFKTSTLLRLFNAGDPSCADQFLRWDHVKENGVEVEDPGLLTRRKLERGLFLTQDKEMDA